MAVSARRAARPNSSRRSCRTGTPGSGPRSPDTASVAAGMPSATTSPWAETVAGAARRVHWATTRLPPASASTSWRTATSTVRRRPIEVGPCALDHGTIQGLRDLRPARSPSTSTASTRRPPAAPTHARRRRRRCRRRSRRARASCAGRGRPGAGTRRPPAGALLRERKMRASSISAAVPDSSASPGVRTASRSASTTMRRVREPGPRADHGDQVALAVDRLRLSARRDV